MTQFDANYMKPFWEKNRFNTKSRRSISLGLNVSHAHYTMHTRKKAKASHEKNPHKEVGQPLIIVNHAINVWAPQMNTALGMRQSVLACYVSLTQFILLFTQDHSHVNSPTFTLPRPLARCKCVSRTGVNVCGRVVPAQGHFITMSRVDFHRGGVTPCNYLPHRYGKKSYFSAARGLKVVAWTQLADLEMRCT